MDTNIIEVSNLRKSFKEIKAVDDISFVVHKGELFAFLGLNGAGKSTTINIITGALEKDSGTVLVNGINVDENMTSIRDKIGIVYQTGTLDRFLSVYDNLKFKAGLYGYTGKKFESRLKEISDELDLKDILNRSLGKLSGGQKRRVDIARALFHKPEILILDEPTTGLDPQTRKMVWKVIEDEMSSRGLTVFLTTHYMEEAAEAHYVVILDKGRIVAKGSPIDLKEKYSHDSLIIYHPSAEVMDMINKERLSFHEKEEVISISISNSSDVIKLMGEYPSSFKDFEVIKGKMDDVFLNVTGRELSNGGNDNA